MCRGRRGSRCSLRSRDHRKPPLPEWYDETCRGICRWCGLVIYHERGPDKGRVNYKRWHNRCVTEFRFLFWPQVTRETLLKERGATCEDCGSPLVGGQGRSKGVARKRIPEVHHIIPLHQYPHDPADPYAAWRRENLALLCHDCHQARHRALRRGDTGGGRCRTSS